MFVPESINGLSNLSGVPSAKRDLKCMQGFYDFTHGILLFNTIKYEKCGKLYFVKFKSRYLLSILINVTVIVETLFINLLPLILLQVETAQKHQWSVAGNFLSSEKLFYYFLIVTT